MSVWGKQKLGTWSQNGSISKLPWRRVADKEPLKPIGAEKQKGEVRDAVKLNTEVFKPSKHVQLLT